MRITREKFSFNSVRVKLVTGVFAILLPLFILLIYGNSYAIGIIYNQVADTHKNLLSLYMDKIDSELSLVDSYLTRTVSDSTFRDAISKASPDRYVLLKVQMTEKLATDIRSYETIDTLFYYNSGREDITYSINPGSSILERDQVIDYITRFLKIRPILTDDSYRRWVIFQIGSENYLFRIFRTGDDYMGAWVKTDNLLIPMNMINLGNAGAAMIIGSHGSQLATSRLIADEGLDLSGDVSNFYLTGSDNQYLIVGAPSIHGYFSLAAVIPEQQILANLIWLRRIIQVLAIFILLLLPISLFLVRQTILTPVNCILSAMMRIRAGDIEVRIPLRRSSNEFQIVDETFNNMLDQIHDLKINVYEEKINSQREELERLRLQVGPHFFLNSLNILFRLTQSKKYELAQEMTLSLIEYFRYSFRKTQDLVPLREEITHVKNYLRIQELRYPKALSCTIMMPDYVGQTPIPPMIVQNFVENSIKYAMTLDEPVHLMIQADLVEAGSGMGPLVEIMIADTGPGFPADVLELLQADLPMKDNNEARIGTWNARRRLQLIYQGQAVIEFSNQEPHGAVVKIRIPLRPFGWQEEPS